MKSTIILILSLGLFAQGKMHLPNKTRAEVKQVSKLLRLTEQYSVTVSPSPEQNVSQDNHKPEITSTSKPGNNNNKTISIHEITSFMVGGRPARTREIKYIVSLSYRGDDGGYFHQCGGSIITTVWVVTAAHCISMPANQMVIRAGIDNLLQQGTFHRIAKIVVHPYFSKQTFRHDIAMVGLYDPIQLSNYVHAIEVIGIDLAGGTPLVASGWGALFAEQPPTNQLMVLFPTYVMDMQECKNEVRNLAPWGQYVDFGQYCIKVRWGQGICQGDSGGPAAMYDRNGVPYLVGLMSWNVPCARGMPDIITSVKQYIPFMRAVTQNN